MTTFYLIGDSHTRVYADSAIALGRKDIIGARLLSATGLQQDFFTVSDGNITFLDKAADNFKIFSQRTGIQDFRKCGNSLVASMGLAPAPFYGDRDWRNYAISPDLRPGRRMILSQAVVEQMVEDLQRPILAFYDWMHQNNLLFAAVSAPAPQRRHPSLRWLGIERVLRLVEMYERPVRAKLKELGCPIVDLPSTVDKEGLLLEEFWGKDWSHGNLEYGKLLIAELDKLRVSEWNKAAENLREKANHPA